MGVKNKENKLIFDLTPCDGCKKHRGGFLAMVSENSEWTECHQCANKNKYMFRNMHEEIRDTGLIDKKESTINGDSTDTHLNQWKSGDRLGFLMKYHNNHKTTRQEALCWIYRNGICLGIGFEKIPYRVVPVCNPYQEVQITIRFGNHTTWQKPPY
ncbi:hypothetical protein RFI_07464 [Reticulomyxa filosa]|uniref:Uncharacterized protein n=1 Tax=Reticulomyxa filosa TaxID=46433 RepID=X6NTN8_RETFI|nr:hypothetical protein RFI_07464 [Reticulomyxa filosa]|eukprot:ETO29655.1 hypothetical protein RFI_07464 [Reticulomyxa filosa]